MSNFYNNNNTNRIYNRKSNYRSNSTKASTFLSCENLNKLPDNRFKKIIEDDINSVSSYASVESFINTNHGMKRMNSRDVTKKEIGIALKRGQYQPIEQENKTVISYKNLVCIIGNNALKNTVLDNNEENISDLIGIEEMESNVNSERWGRVNINTTTTNNNNNKVLITVWKVNTYELNPNEFETYSQLKKILVEDKKYDSVIHLPKFQNIVNESISNGENIQNIINFLQNNNLNRFTLLTLASFQNKYELVKILIENGGNPVIISLSKKKYNCLFYLLSNTSIKSFNSENDRYNIIKLCIEKLKKDNADIIKFMNYKSPYNGQLLLQKAVFMKLERISQLLIDNGADPDIEYVEKGGCSETARALSITNQLNLIFPKSIPLLNSDNIFDKEEDKEEDILDASIKKLIIKE
jgi:hypothetical protein